MPPHPSHSTDLLFKEVFARRRRLLRVWKWTFAWRCIYRKPPPLRTQSYITFHNNNKNLVIVLHFASVLKKALFLCNIRQNWLKIKLKPPCQILDIDISMLLLQNTSIMINIFSTLLLCRNVNWNFFFKLIHIKEKISTDVLQVHKNVTNTRSIWLDIAR